MKHRNRFVGEILIEIARDLDITETMHAKAIKSYEAVGNWIGEVNY